MSVMRVENVFANFEHDVNICFEYEGKVYSYELERLFKERYFGFSSPSGWSRSFEQLSKFKNILLNEFQSTNIVFSNLFYNEDLMWGNDKSYVTDNFSALFATKNLYELDHHECHASCAFYQSPFDESLIFSYDGGGMGANVRSHSYKPEEWDFTVLYLASRKNGIRRLDKIPINMGGFYNHLCSFPEVIQWKPLSSMAGCGKFMGLSGHSYPDPFVVDNLKNTFYENPFHHKDGLTIKSDEEWDLVKHFGYEDTEFERRDYIKNFDEASRFASNWQVAFEQIVIEMIRPFVEKYNYPICITGGCALNVLVNERIRTTFDKEVFVPPNPSDCGLGIGGLAVHTDSDIRDTVYNNFDLLDRYTILDGNCSDLVDVTKLADIICEGKILGVVNGRSECGPRALGNRSILCDPSIPDMKDTLNAKVKFREWFRPFAPMVRYEDRNKYFVFDGDSPYMSFACPVRETYRDELSAITHIDGTARLQTVKESDNPFIYELLTELERKGNIPVLLNTSFNIKGKPILTTVDDALGILGDTDLDNVYIEGKLF